MYLMNLSRTILNVVIPAAVLHYNLGRHLHHDVDTLDSHQRFSEIEIQELKTLRIEDLKERDL